MSRLMSRNGTRMRGYQPDALVRVVDVNGLSAWSYRPRRCFRPCHAIRKRVVAASRFQPGLSCLPGPAIPLCSILTLQISQMRNGASWSEGCLWRTSWGRAGDRSSRRMLEQKARARTRRRRREGMRQATVPLTIMAHSGQMVLEADEVTRGASLQMRCWQAEPLLLPLLILLRPSAQMSLLSSMIRLPFPCAS